MAGLLDGIDLSQLQSMLGVSEEEKRAARQQAIMALGLGLMGARKGEEWNRVGMSGLNAMNQYQGALAGIPAAKLHQVQAAGGLMDLRQKMQAMQDEQKARETLSNFRLPTAPAGSMPSMAFTPEVNATKTPAPKMTPYDLLNAQADALQAQGLVTRAEKMREQALKFRDENMGEPRVVQGPDGKPLLIQQKKYGGPEPMQYQPTPKFREVNRGGQVDIVNDYSLPQGGMSFSTTMNPYQIEQNRIAQGHLNIAVNADKRAAANEGKPQIIAGPNGEVYAVNAKTMQGAPVLGPDGQPLNKGEKALTESQAKATAFANQMQNATAILDQLEQKQGFTGATSFQQGKLAAASGTGIPFVPGSAAIPKWFAGDTAQKYNQAQLQWTEAALRFMTGANAPEQEVRRNVATYFPVPGEGADVIEQKRQMRAAMEQSIRMAAGPGVKKIPQRPGDVRAAADAILAGQ